MQRQMAWCYFKPFLKLWISNPKLADRFIFHYIIPADATNELHNCQDCLARCLSASYWTYAASVTSLPGQRLADHVDIPTSLKKPQKAQWKGFACAKQRCKGKLGLDCWIGHDPVIRWGSGEVKHSRWTCRGHKTGKQTLISCHMLIGLWTLGK